MTYVGLCVVVHAILAAAPLSPSSTEHLKVSLSWGRQASQSMPHYIKLLAENAEIRDLRARDLESDDTITGNVSRTHAGGGDIDGVEFTLRYTLVQIKTIGNLHSIWSELLARSDSETVRRLKQDPAYRPDSRKLTIQMDEEGTKGFSLTVDQMLEGKVFWIPSLGIYLTAGHAPVSFADYLKDLEAYKGKRILEQQFGPELTAEGVRQEPEATYQQYTRRWEDMGNPAYQNRHMSQPGHVVCLTWDSALYKFGIDPLGSLWNDYGNPDCFRFWLDFGDPAEGMQESWKGQRLEDGLPVVTTTLQRQNVRYEVEQCAYPLNGPPNSRKGSLTGERQGDIPMVLLQKVKVTNLQGRDVSVSIKAHHRRQFDSADTREMTCHREGETFIFEEKTSHRILFAIAGSGVEVNSYATKPDPQQADAKKPAYWTQFDAVLTLKLSANASKEFIVKFPSPMAGPQDRDKLVELDYDACRRDTLKFWSDYVARGAQFRVPEKVVNDLFAANLWHALRLPRRHGGHEQDVKIDLPYSNFAYDQRGTPWPVNQAVYVDYMIYGLRGYDDIAAEELLTIFRNNQQADGRVAGYANWGVYTPSMIYAAAENFRLSGDREQFERLLPSTLKAIDWCLSQIRSARENQSQTAGLIRSPLNDLTGEGTWAFTQAYICAALETLGKALETVEHPRAKECLEAAESYHRSVQRAFAAASVRSPLVQLRDQTWTPYVPCEAASSGRLFKQWYPTDVDTGAMHLLRLRALPADGPLADCLLNDHEDNLYLNGWGMANEPVYNPQATAYLLRDEPEAAIRAFYSYMACAFSHSVLEPVEHRWGWGQYFGPPSTDGAWFELYRHMLIHELDDGTLLLLQATPRQWLEDGKRIEIERAPTYYGPLSISVESKAAAGQLTAQIEMPNRSEPSRLIVRFRHPQKKTISAVSVNGRDWTDYDAQKEWVVIPEPKDGRYTIIVHY